MLSRLRCVYSYIAVGECKGYEAEEVTDRSRVKLIRINFRRSPIFNICSVARELRPCFRSSSWSLCDSSGKRSRQANGSTTGLKRRQIWLRHISVSAQRVARNGGCNASRHFSVSLLVAFIGGVLTCDRFCLPRRAVFQATREKAST